MCHLTSVYCVRERLKINILRNLLIIFTSLPKTKLVWVLMRGTLKLIPLNTDDRLQFLSIYHIKSKNRYKDNMKIPAQFLYVGTPCILNLLQTMKFVNRNLTWFQQVVV